MASASPPRARPATREETIKAIGRAAGARVVGIASAEAFIGSCPRATGPQDILPGARSVVVAGGDGPTAGAWRCPDNRVMEITGYDLRENVAVHAMCDYIEHEHGYYAIQAPSLPVHGHDPPMSMMLAAVLAGLGSRSLAANIILNPDYGLLYYAALITTLPLESDQKLERRLPVSRLRAMFKKLGTTPCLRVVPGLPRRLDRREGRIDYSYYNRERCHARSMNFGIGTVQKSLVDILNEDDPDAARHDLLRLLHADHRRAHLLQGERRAVLRVHARVPGRPQHEEAQVTGRRRRRSASAVRRGSRGGRRTLPASPPRRDADGVEYARAKAAVGEALRGGAGSPVPEASARIAPERLRPDDLLPGARTVVVVGGAAPRAGDWRATRHRSTRRRWAPGDRINALGLKIAKYIEDQFGYYGLFVPPGTTRATPRSSASRSPPSCRAAARAAWPARSCTPSTGSSTTPRSSPRAARRRTARPSRSARRRPASTCEGARHHTLPRRLPDPERRVSGRRDRRGRFAERALRRRALPLARLHPLGARFPEGLEAAINETDHEKRKMILYSSFFTRTLWAITYSAQSQAQCFECMRVCPVADGKRDLK